MGGWRSRLPERLRASKPFNILAGTIVAVRKSDALATQKDHIGLRATIAFDAVIATSWRLAQRKIEAITRSGGSNSRGPSKDTVKIVYLTLQILTEIAELFTEPPPSRRRSPGCRTRSAGCGNFLKLALRKQPAPP